MNGELLRAVQAQRPEAQATLDMDATLIETHKREALYCYKHFKAYQPLNTWWAEPGLIVHSEFRDGNVPAGHEQLRVLEEATRLLPEGVTKLCLRSDTADRWPRARRGLRPPHSIGSAIWLHLISN